MKHPGVRFCLAATAIAVLMGLPVLTEQAGGRGFSGGSFRGDGGYVEGSQGGGVAVGPGGGVAARGPGGNAIAVLPDGAARVSVNGRDYFVADGIYYQPCYVGADVNYCVVDTPAQDDDGDDDGDDDSDDS